MKRDADVFASAIEADKLRGTAVDPARATDRRGGGKAVAGNHDHQTGVDR
jgi:hypothetical protein